MSKRYNHAYILRGETMNMRKRLNISAYLVVGPENTNGRPVENIVRDAVEAGFTCARLGPRLHQPGN